MLHILESNLEFSSMDFFYWLLLVQVLTSTVRTNAKVSAVIVFGDSTVDAGNNNNISTVAKSDFAPYGRDFMGGKPTGRFCNGRLATDFISQAFGLRPLVPAYLDPAFGIQDFATGVSFASAGSGFDNATSDVLSVIPLWKELEYFKEYSKRLKAFQGEEKARETLHEALYVMSSGTNDFLENYFTVPGRSSQFTVDEYENFLVGIAECFIREIYYLGARKIDITGLAPMGCLPLERAEDVINRNSCNEFYNIVAQNFNLKLQNLAAKMNKELWGIKIVFANIYQIVMDVVGMPSSYGFDDVERGCCATGMFEMGYICNKRSLFTCPDANKYVFWDAFHPTEKMNYVLAARLMKASLSVFW